VSLVVFEMLFEQRSGRILMTDDVVERLTESTTHLSCSVSLCELGSVAAIQKAQFLSF
jgi:hypothetical protein